MKKNGFTLIELLVLIAIIAVAMGLGFTVGKTKAKAEYKQEMVAKGVAHYEVDKDGNVSCLWNTPEVVTVAVTNSVLK